MSLLCVDNPDVPAHLRGNQPVRQAVNRVRSGFCLFKIPDSVDDGVRSQQEKQLRSGDGHGVFERVIHKEKAQSLKFKA